MKRMILLLAGICAFSGAYSQGMALNTTGAAANTSAMLDVASTTKGFLPPRMTTAQKRGISSPANGLVVYQTDSTTGLYCNGGTPSVPNWQLVGPAAVTPLAYGYYYAGSVQNVSAPTNINFSITNSSNNMSMNGLGAQVTINTTGLYLVSYELDAQLGSGSLVNILSAITVNGINTSPYRNVAIYDGNTAPISSQRILSLHQNDIISVLAVNGISGTSVSIPNATLTIVQMQ